MRDYLDRFWDRALAAKPALAYLISSFHNPTGYSMQADEWQKVASCLLSHASKAPITLLVDCAYFAYNAGDPRAFYDGRSGFVAHRVDQHRIERGPPDAQCPCGAAVGWRRVRLRPTPRSWR